ncbi:MAG: hypothetical protein RBR15_05080 [Sphaerochaeta sp.]|nr:hypothetical protein [Sphaerochaeta sp.]
MKKLAKTVAIAILVALATTSLFAANGNQTAVARLTAYIAERTTFTTFDGTFVVESNAYNFTYSVEENNRTRMLFVVAN